MQLSILLYSIEIYLFFNYLWYLNGISGHSYGMWYFYMDSKVSSAIQYNRILSYLSQMELISGHNGKSRNYICFYMEFDALNYVHNNYYALICAIWK